MITPTETKTKPNNKSLISKKEKVANNRYQKIKLIHKDDLYITTRSFAEIADIHEKSIYKMIKESKIEAKNIDGSMMIPTSALREYILEEKKEKKRKKPKFLPYTPTHKVISIFNIKGGVGKTSLTLQLGLFCVSKGLKILINDFDMQANLTTRLQIKQPSKEKTFLHIHEGLDIRKAIIEVTPNLHIIPSNITFGNMESKIDFKDGFNQFKDPIDEIKGEYDLILNDCPHSVTNISFCAVYSSDLVVIPVIPCDLSKEGLDETLKQISKAKKRGANVEAMAVMNMFNQKEIQSKKYANIYTNEYRDILANKCIRRLADISSSTSLGISIFEYSNKKDSSACEDIENFSKIFLTENQAPKKILKN